MQAIGIVVGVVFAALAAVHVYWAFGGRFGIGSAVPEQGGRPAFSPGKAMTLAVAGALAAASLVVLGRVGVAELVSSRLAYTVGCAALAIIFAARAVGDRRYVGFFKRVRGTRFARLDSLFFSPLCAALATGCAAVALS